METSEKEDDYIQAYSAGYAEAVLTHELIYLYWRNTVDGWCDGKTAVCERIEGFIQKNTEWMEQMMRNSSSDPYWHQVTIHVPKSKNNIFFASCKIKTSVFSSHFDGNP